MLASKIIKALRTSGVDLQVRVIHTADDDVWVSAVKTDYIQTLTDAVGELRQYHGPEVDLEIKADFDGKTVWVG